MKLPHSPESERAIVAALMLRPTDVDAIVGALHDDDFHEARHRAIYLAAVKLFDRGEPIDVMTLERQLRAADALNMVGGSEALGAITDAHRWLPIDIDHHVEVVRKLARVREAITICRDIASSGDDAVGDPDAWLDRVGEELSHLQSRERGGYVHLRDSVGDVLRDIFARKDLPFVGVPTPFVGLDDLLCGLEPGDLVILAARPSVGKTALGLQWLRHVTGEGYPGLCLSIEMRTARLIRRLLANEARVHASRLRSGKLEGGDAAALIAAAGRLEHVPIDIDDATKKVNDIRAVVRAWRRDRSVPHRPDGLGLVMVDYLQLAEGSGGEYDTREREVSEISRGLKALAKEIKMPVLALCQLNRAVETKPQQPQLSHLRESGSLEQDADVVLFLWAPDPKAPTEIELVVGKQRDGARDSIALTFDGRYQRFTQTEESKQTEMPT